MNNMDELDKIKEIQELPMRILKQEHRKFVIVKWVTILIMIGILIFAGYEFNRLIDIYTKTINLIK